MMIPMILNHFSFQSYKSNCGLKLKIDANLETGEWQSFVSYGGEDLDSDGNLDEGEDTNDNNILDQVVGINWLLMVLDLNQSPI